MSEEGTTPVTARVAFGTKQLLADIRPLFKAERARARALSATPRWDWDGLPGREAAAKRAQWAMYRTHLRETGELSDTLDVLVASSRLASRRAPWGVRQSCSDAGAAARIAGSADIGGADADFILGGLLLDCKATTRPRQLGISEIYQLAGYLLLDYDDRYSIDQVGLYLSRQGHLITWSINDFLHRAGATALLPALRRKLRDFLQAEGREA